MCQCWYMSMITSTVHGMNNIKFCPFLYNYIFPVVQKGMFPQKFHKVSIYCLIHAYRASNGTVFCKARVTCAVSNTEDSSLAICLRLTNRRHSMLRRHRIVFAHREYIVIVSSSVSEILYETKGSAVSYTNCIAIVSK